MVSSFAGTARRLTVLPPRDPRVLLGLQVPMVPQAQQVQPDLRVQTARRVRLALQDRLVPTAPRGLRVSGLLALQGLRVPLVRPGLTVRQALRA